MADKIYAFKSVDDAVSILKKYKPKKATPKRSIDEIVHSTQGNTVRAFRNVGYNSSSYSASNLMIDRE